MVRTSGTPGDSAIGAIVGAQTTSGATPISRSIRGRPHTAAAPNRTRPGSTWRCTTTLGAKSEQDRAPSREKQMPLVVGVRAGQRGQQLAQIARHPSRTGERPSVHSDPHAAGTVHAMFTDRLAPVGSRRPGDRVRPMSAAGRVAVGERTRPPRYLHSARGSRYEARGGQDAGRASGPGACVQIVLFVLAAGLAAFTIVQGIAPHDEGLMLQAGARIASASGPTATSGPTIRPVSRSCWPCCRRSSAPRCWPGGWWRWPSTRAWRCWPTAWPGAGRLRSTRWARGWRWPSVMAFPMLPGPNPPALLLSFAASAGGAPSSRSGRRPGRSGRPVSLRAGHRGDRRRAPHRAARAPRPRARAPRRPWRWSRWGRSSSSPRTRCGTTRSASTRSRASSACRSRWPSTARGDPAS